MIKRLIKKILIAKIALFIALKYDITNVYLCKIFDSEISLIYCKNP